jgi:hypothetical protein
MPQITITFDAIEERQDALDAINVHEYKAKIDDALEFIHRKLKYDENVSEETLHALAEVRSILEE